MMGKKFKTDDTNFKVTKKTKQVIGNIYENPELLEGEK